jgi:hypothetical protein
VTGFAQEAQDQTGEIFDFSWILLKMQGSWD